MILNNSFLKIINSAKFRPSKASSRKMMVKTCRYPDRDEDGILEIHIGTV
jgi:hypothetical protein